VYVMIENRKFGAVSMLSYCRIGDITAIITEKMPNEEFRVAYSALGKSIMIAN